MNQTCISEGGKNVKRAVNIWARWGVLTSAGKKKLLQKLARDEGTPVFVIDHERFEELLEFKAHPICPGILCGQSKLKSGDRKDTF
jgi:hypothetical protein